jgi:Icc-related predicted phosphoesterase
MSSLKEYFTLDKKEELKHKKELTIQMLESALEHIKKDNIYVYNMRCNEETKTHLDLRGKSTVYEHNFSFYSCDPEKNEAMITKE